MWHSRKLNNKIDRLQERALSIVYDDKSSAFYQLLEKDNSVTIHTRNLQYLATEIFKIKIGISPIIITEIFKFSDNTTHNLRSGQVLERRHNRTTNFGVESISTLGAKIWALVPENLRQSTSLNIFKRGIKKWNPSNCPCRLCKIYVQNVAFIWLIIPLVGIELSFKFLIKKKNCNTIKFILKIQLFCEIYVKICKKHLIVCLALFIWIFSLGWTSL